MTIRIRILVAAVAVSAIATVTAASEIPTGESQRVAESSHRKPAGDDTPEYYFQLACLNCKKGDQSAAGRHVSKAIELLKREAKGATRKGEAALDRSVFELEKLAESLENGAAVSMDHVESAFARSSHALAYHYQQRASESWLRRKYKQAGEDLRAAAYNVEYGVSWVGEGVETKSRDVLVASRDLGSELIAGSNVEANRLESRVKSLGREIKRFGRRVAKPVQR